MSDSTTAPKPSEADRPQSEPPSTTAPAAPRGPSIIARLRAMFLRAPSLRDDLEVALEQEASGETQDFSIPDDRCGCAVGVHSAALALILNDSMWTKYSFGSRFSVNNAQGQPATANPYAAGGAASVEGMRRRGVEVLACNRSLARLGRDLAGAGGNAQAVHTELVANVVPGVIVVPAMIVATSRSQQRGIPYIAVA